MLDIYVCDRSIHFHDFMLDVHSRLPVRKNIWFQTWDQWVYLCLYRGGHPTTNLISPFAQKIELWEFWCSRYVFLNHYRMTLEFTHYIHTFLYLIHSSTWWAASLYLGLNTGSDMEKVISVGREMIDHSTFELHEQRKCITCQGIGHNSRTCPKKKQDMQTSGNFV